ncbi:hypothetical protein GCM10017567_54180 [Amycolatopsis bullii]|uniref:Uncharacterized protein n=1 Tax=Amycolatopsis bullii TaxID=941987 RepID=A0ABQ3KN04_9PSEU|nr:hypothetical protein GCM10017567_54180 [Amycolatopsis bullii]
MRRADHAAVQPGGDSADPVVVEEAPPRPLVRVVGALDREVRVLAAGQFLPAGAVGLGEKPDVDYVASGSIGGRSPGLSGSGADWVWPAR